MNKAINKEIKKIGKPKIKISVFGILICLFLALYSALLLGLIIWALRASFLPYDYNKFDLKYSLSFDAWGFNNEFHPENYLYVLKYFTSEVNVDGKVYKAGLADAFFNSTTYALFSAFLQTFCTALVAYLTAKYDNKFSRFFHTFVLFSLVLPIAGSAASLFSIVFQLGIYNTWLAPIFMKFAFTNMYYLVFYAGFKRISWNYAESAFIDGAGHFYVFFRIMLPLVLGLFGTVMLVYFIEYWNDYSFPLLYMPKYPTAAVLMQQNFLGNTFYPIRKFITIDGQVKKDFQLFKGFPMQTAAATLSCLPIVVLFIIFHKKLTGNLTEGGIKE